MARGYRYLAPIVKLGVRVWLISLSLVVTASAIAASPSMATSVRVPADYYGINYHRMNLDAPSVRDLVLNAIAAHGFDQVRFTIPWVDIEPEAPEAGVHSYHYIFPDQLVASLAQRGLTGQITFWKTPGWNLEHPGGVGSLQCANVKSQAPKDLQAYGLAAAAVVKRYGPSGTFWTENPGLPFRPIRVFEVWNEPNLRGSWCPAVEPDRYARMLLMAAKQIHAADPEVKVVSGGIPLASGSGDFMKPGEFMNKVLAESPSIRRLVDSVGIHVYPFGAMKAQLKPVTEFRTVLHDAGLPDKVPLSMNEMGWSTGGPNAITENERVDRYKHVPQMFPQTNCNVDAVAAHSWTTNEVNSRNNQDWFGIANPLTGVPYPSGRAYQRTIAVMRGQRDHEAPHAFIDACPGMPEPDSDGDGHTDAHDYYPYDNTQWEGPPGWDDTLPAAHKHARKACRRWYETSRPWRTSGHDVHQSILTACVARYLELKKSGELGPLKTAARTSCRASTPPVYLPRGHHGARRHRLAVDRCTFKRIRHGFALDL
jgi:hypothetical protein